VPSTSAVDRRVQDQADVSWIGLGDNARVMVFGNDDRQEIVADELQLAREPRLTRIRLKNVDVDTGDHHSFS
jgi:hypothetical protein